MWLLPSAIVTTNTHNKLLVVSCQLKLPQRRRERSVRSTQRSRGQARGHGPG